MSTLSNARTASHTVNKWHFSVENVKFSVKAPGRESCWHGGGKHLPFRNSKPLRWQQPAKCAFLAAQSAAIKAVSKDLPLKDPSVTAPLTLMHSSDVCHVCFPFSTKSLFVRRQTSRKNKLFAYFPRKPLLYVLPSVMLKKKGGKWNILQTNKPRGTVTESNIREKANYLKKNPKKQKKPQPGSV